MSSKLESDVCCRLQVAPSGESYEGKRRPGRKQWQTTAKYMAWFTSRHLRADCLYTGISFGPNARWRVWENFTFLLLNKNCSDVDIFSSLLNVHMGWCLLNSAAVSRYSRHFVASRINALAVVVAVVFTVDHIVTIQRTMGWTKSLIDRRYIPSQPTRLQRPSRRQTPRRDSRRACVGCSVASVCVCLSVCARSKRKKTVWIVFTKVGTGRPTDIIHCRL